MFSYSSKVTLLSAESRDGILYEPMQIVTMSFYRVVVSDCMLLCGVRQYSKHSLE